MAEVSVTKERLGAYLKAKFPQRQELSVVRLEPMTVGLSYKSYLFTMSWREAEDQVSETLIIRMEPEFGVLPPYDIKPQYEVLKRLQGTEIPVPKVSWLEMDSKVLGRPFLTMERIEGENLLPYYGKHPEYQTQLAKAYPRLLAKIHGLDWQNLGLSVLGVPDNAHQFAENQIARFGQQAEESQYTSQPLIAELITWLRKNIPLAERTTLCHGDFHAENVLARDGQIITMLDWELAATGDPISDVGYAVVFLRIYGWLPGHLEICSEADFLRDYQEAAGVKVNQESLFFYKILNLFKLIAIALAGLQASIKLKDANMSQFGIWIPLLPLMQDEAARLLGF